ncbi:MAG: hypothetical protein GY833_12760 [Aestuariibacter sp.]|nr:hypothetical protein [Aestuariibacter sp.]|tara:strand:+ start:130162 stop:130362 length:201 start_codon:yes stop_codon:yes gene_type:complete
MHVSNYKDKWLSIFASHRIDQEIAEAEWQEWVSGLDGEYDNEYTQNEHAVIVAAEEAVNELLTHGD